jgi:hypothetical protein
MQKEIPRSIRRLESGKILYQLRIFKDNSLSGATMVCISLKTAYEYSKILAVIAYPSLSYKGSQRAFNRNVDCWIYDTNKFGSLAEALATTTGVTAGKIEKTRFFI